MAAATVFAGLLEPVAMAVPVKAAAAAATTAPTDPFVPRPMPPDPYHEWDGKAGVPELTTDPRFRQIVADNAELAEDFEVRDAAAAALAGGNDAIMAFLNGGMDEAQAKAAARKQETARQDRAAIEPLRGTGGPYLKAEIDRVLAGSDSDRAAFLAYGKAIAEQRDAQSTQDERTRLEQNRARAQMLVDAGGPEVKKAAQAALAGGDTAIAEFLKTGYLVAAKSDADAREAALKAQEERDKAAEALSDLAKKAARASEARRNLLTAHGNGVRALEKVSNALVSAGTEARKAEQILAANTAGGQHPLDAFDGVKAEVARQLGYASQASTEAQQAAALAQVQAGILVDTGLTYGVQWAQMAQGMAAAAQAAVKASETAQHAIDATAFTDQARNAQEKAERHAEEAKQWRLHAEEHARAAAAIAEAARVQAEAAKDAAARTKQARAAAEKAEGEAWAAAERTRNARITAEREADKAAAARAVAERERANAAAARSRAEQQAAVARSARGEADAQAAIAAGARQRAEAQDGIAAQCETRARTEEGNAATARDRAYTAEQAQRSTEARAQAVEAAAAAARGTDNEVPAQNAAKQARTEANTAAGAAGAARGAANTATGAAVGARSAATEATRAAARARAAAQEAAAAAARANAAANQAEAEAAATHAAALRANSAAADATANEAKAAEAARSATALAEQAASEAMQSLRSAERTKAEADAASAEAVSAATQANLAVQAALAARSSAQAITDPANTAITVATPFAGSDIDADFVVLVANQAKAVGAEQAKAAQNRANEAVEAAKQAADAAERANAEVKPAFTAAAAAAASSAAAARSAADAQQAAAEAAADGAAARAAAARANDADAQAHADAVRARNAANAASNDAAIAGRAASAAENDAAAARSAASAAEADAAAARNSAANAERDAAAANAAADSAQKHAEATAEAAKHARDSAVEAGKAADRAEAKAREDERQNRQNSAQEAGHEVTDQDDDAFEDSCLEDGHTGDADLAACIQGYRDALSGGDQGIAQFIVENGAQVLLGFIGWDDIQKCFGEGNIEACIWTAINVIPVGKVFSLLKKLPEVGGAIYRIITGIPKLLEKNSAIRKIREKANGIIEKFKKDTEGCLVTGNSFAPDTPVWMAGGYRKPIRDVRVGDRVTATDPVLGRTEGREVTDVIVGNGEKHMVAITVDTDGDAGDATGTVVATDAHPFWVDEQGRWIDAKDVATGSHLLTPAGARLTVVGTRAWTETRQVFNLSVDGIHTYYVGAGSADVLVHNCAKKNPRRSGKERASDIPSWAQEPLKAAGNNPAEKADNVMRQRFPDGNYPKGPGTEYNKILKFITRNR